MGISGAMVDGPEDQEIKPEREVRVVYGTFVKQSVSWATKDFGERVQQLQTEDGLRVDVSTLIGIFAPTEDDGPVVPSALAKIFDKGPGQRVALTLVFNDSSHKTAEVREVMDLGRDENPLRGGNSYAFDPHIRATAPREIGFR